MAHAELVGGESGIVDELGPFEEHTCPAWSPPTSHDLNNGEFTAARARTAARMTATVMDLSREIPNIRAFALCRWHEATQHLAAHPDDAAAVRAERDHFWDWALLELLLTSGLRRQRTTRGVATSLVGTDGYDLDNLRADLTRFAFLLGTALRHH